MFLYFDLGNVLLNFSHQRASEQMGAVCGIPPSRVREVVFDTDLERRFESGAVDDRQFYDEFCRATGTQPDYDALLHAGSEIFELNTPIVPVIAQLKAAGYRMGILSNTCGPHWRYCSEGRYGLVRNQFEVFALSYKIGAFKPEPKIYEVAAQMAGVEPRDIFYTDDMLVNVEAACEFGLDAVQFTTTAQLVDDMRARGIRFNY